ncbi:hypothetical protein [Mesorhizobium loti]|uniref:hypothetical protein n=1 Tax=Rhizobium loti TaxID=381 RepID=UPI00047AADA7|nr:hypothetical protein [Mesorhizobium loti]
MSGLALHSQEKTSLEQEAKAGLLVGGLVLGLLHHLLHVVVVVVMMMVVVPVVVAMMMVVTMMMMLCHRGRFRAGCTDHRNRESNCNCNPEGRDEGLLHGSFPFFAGIYKSGR